VVWGGFWEVLEEVVIYPALRGYADSGPRLPPFGWGGAGREREGGGLGGFWFHDIHSALSGYSCGGREFSEDW